MLETEVLPQAAEGTFSVDVAPTVNSVQNVTFIDSAAHHVAHTDSMNDPVRDHALIQDAELGDFLSRPAKIVSIPWSVGTQVNLSFDPWGNYLGLPSVINRLNHYRLLRGRLHIKIVISGTQFHYGRLLVHYLPLPFFDGYSFVGSTPATDSLMTLFSQRPHAWINPTTSKGCEMVLPFFWPANAVDIVTGNYDILGSLGLSTVDPLSHANGGDSDVSINVFAWMEECRFAIPTHVNSAGLLPQSLEIVPQSKQKKMKPQPENENPGVVSRISTTVAAVAGKLTSAPVIGPYAKATEIGAKAVGAIGSLFGFSRPVMKESSMFRPRTKANLAVTNIVDDIPKLTVDVNQEITVDPRVADLGDTDEMDLSYVAGKESYLTSFPWTTNTAEETLLWNAVVEPTACHTTTTSDGFAYDLTALAYAAVPFSYWRGKLKYRFQVVSSAVHRGRLKVVYDPVKTLPTGSFEQTTTQYTTIVDIGETTDFCITIGWGQPLSYRPILPLIEAQTRTLFDTTALSYDSTVDFFGNGTIAVYCMNQLVSTSNSGNDIKVYVSVSAEEIEFAVPESRSLSELRLSSVENVAPLPAILPQSADDAVEDAAAPEVVESLDQLASGGEFTDQTNDVFFGEKVASFRQLLKRYCSHTTMPLQASPPNRVTDFYLNSFPTPAGWYVSALPHQGQNTIAAYFTGSSPAFDRYYLYGDFTLINFVSCAYAGWRGSTRWYANPSFEITEHTLGNYDDNNVIEGYVPKGTTASFASYAYRASIRDAYRRSSGHNGLTLEKASIQPFINAEIPFYTNVRFIPSRIRQDPQVPDSFQLKYTYTVTQGNDAQDGYIRTGCAIGEDFNCLFYVGPPRLYYQPVTPLANPL